MFERKTSAETHLLAIGKSKGFMWLLELSEILEILSAHRFRHIFIFSFGVDYYHFNIKHKSSGVFQVLWRIDLPEPDFDNY